MFYRQESNQYINEGQSFTVNGVTYPSNWLNQSTPAQKQALGLVEVVVTNSPASPEFYWVSETLSGATKTYVNTPKDLAQVKENSLEKISTQAYSILLPTDWVEARNIRDPLYKADVMTWRNSIRTTASTQSSLVSACTTVDAIAALFPIAWPEL